MQRVVRTTPTVNSLDFVILSFFFFFFLFLNQKLRGRVTRNEKKHMALNKAWQAVLLWWLRGLQDAILISDNLIGRLKELM